MKPRTFYIAKLDPYDGRVFDKDPRTFSSGVSPHTVKEVVEKSAYDQLLAQADKLAKALEFYADKNNWRYSSNNDISALDAWLDFKPDHFCKTRSELGGFNARQALAEWNEFKSEKT